MRGMRREDQQVDCILNAEPDHIGCYMAAMSVHNEQLSYRWVRRQRRRLENRGEPLVSMTVRCPTAVASGEPPVQWRGFRYPASVGVFGLENDQRRYCASVCAYALDRCNPLLSAIDNLPAGCLAYIDQCY